MECNDRQKVVLSRYLEHAWKAREREREREKRDIIKKFLKLNFFFTIPIFSSRYAKKIGISSCKVWMLRRNYDPFFTLQV